MASLSEVRPVLQSTGMWGFFKRVYQQATEDEIFVWGSALAYSWLFAIFPFLILVLTLVPYMPTNAKDTAYQTITQNVDKMLGKEAPTINENLASVMHNQRTGLLSLGIIVTIWVAANGMSMTMSSLDRCYDITNTRPYWKQQGLAILLTLGAIICMLLILILMPIGSAVGKWLVAQHVISGLLLIAFEISRYVLAIFLSLFVLSIIYYFGPNIKQHYRFLSPGSVFSTIVWLGLTVAFRFYINHIANYNKMYGSVGGVALLLFFFYVDALVLLIGAEINSEIDFQSLGVRSGSQDFTGPSRFEKDKEPEMSKEL